MVYKIEDVLNAAYNSEINVTLSSFWDSGWTATIGDAINGYKGEPIIRNSLAGIAKCLVEEICICYPDSLFAKEYNKIYTPYYHITCQCGGMAKRIEGGCDINIAKDLAIKEGWSFTDIGIPLCPECTKKE